MIDREQLEAARTSLVETWHELRWLLVAASITLQRLGEDGDEEARALAAQIEEAFASLTSANLSAEWLLWDRENVR